VSPCADVTSRSDDCRNPPLREPSDSDARALQELVDDVSDLLRAPATLEDTGFALLAYGSHGPDGVDQVRAASILRKTAAPAVRSYFLEQGIASATAPVRIPAHENRQIAARVCIPVRAGGRTLGYLWVVEPAHGVDAEALLRVAPLADRAGMLLARRAGVADERAGLVDALLIEDVGEQAAAWRRLVAVGELTDGEPLVVAVVRMPDGERRRTVMSLPAGALPEVAVRRVTRNLPAGAVAGVSDSIVVSGEMSATGPGVGVSGPGAGPVWSSSPSLAARQADVAALVAHARPQLGSVLSWDGLGFYRVVMQGRAAVEALIAGTPATRLRARADADLIRTALVWLDQGGNAARTAAALSVHRQTLYYRLERIEQLAGVNLDEGEARLGLHVGLALAEVLTRGPA
jgi:hypothetical protein